VRRRGGTREDDDRRDRGALERRSREDRDDRRDRGVIEPRSGEPVARDDSVVRSARQDDDAQDDTNAQLRAMRAVWLSMRAEDPPDGGLVDLLAAARAKAATMRVRPTLRQRVVAVLRRPPALAFATVVVLVGGAVLFIGRGSGMRSELAAGSSGAFKSHAQPLDDKSAIAQPSSAPAPSAAPRGSDRSEPPVRVERAVGAVTVTSKDAPSAGDAVRPAEPITRGVSAGAGRAPGAHEHHGAGARDPDGAEPPVDPSEESVVVAEGRADAAKAAATGKQALLEELHKQCESAARRGDCATVRQMVGRIAKTDRDYRARVVKEAAVAKCLADAGQ
jgi:hypothetical protein